MARHQSAAIRALYNPIYVLNEMYREHVRRSHASGKNTGLEGRVITNSSRTIILTGAERRYAPLN